jgi:hypothetical protein
VIGFPSDFLISTSHIERQNLSVRMASRRFTRLTNGFSKTMPNHAAAVALYIAHYNLCRVHQTLRMTPAMSIGVADHAWSIAELIDATEAAGRDDPTAPVPPPIPQRPRFTVIQGGRQ